MKHIIFKAFYNLLINIIRFLIPVASILVDRLFPEKKIALFLRGQRNAIKELMYCAENIKHGEHKVIWIHCASLGEFGIARPLIRKVKSLSNAYIVVTFFSPSGYEALKKKHKDIDCVLYLPFDTSSNVKKFLNVINPDRAIFMVSELWYNYLSELRKRRISTYLLSAQITDKSLLSRWYGGAYRDLLDTFTCISTLSKETSEILYSMGYDRVELTDDPLCDNVTVVAETPYRNVVLEKFSEYGPLFIAGSVNDEKDMSLMFSLINSNPDIRFVFVPHEVSKSNIDNIKSSINGNTVSYNECDDNIDLSDVQVIIIDYIGELSYIYRYGTWAYVGGGFTPYLHNMLEATVYGLPVAFGPVIDRKEIARVLIDERLGWIVRNERELEAWFETLKNNSTEMERICREAKEFIKKRIGGTDRILQILDIN